MPKMEENMTEASIKTEYDNGYCEYIVMEQWGSSEIKQEPDAKEEETGGDKIDIGPTTIGPMVGNEEPQDKLPQEQNTNCCCSTTIKRLEKKIDEIKETVQQETTVLQGQLQLVLQALAEQQVILGQLKRQPSEELPLQSKFPVQSEEDLQTIESEITHNNWDLYVKVIKSILTPYGVRKGLRHILSDNITQMYNIQGVHNKKALKNVPNFYGALLASSTAAPLQQNERQAPELSSLNQDVVSTNIAACHPFNQILIEIRAMNEVNQRMFRTLTEEIISLRNEVRQLRSLPTAESEANLLPPLPFSTLAVFQEFDQKLLVESDLRVNLKDFLLRVGGSDLSAFTRLALRRILSDEASTHITWCGTNDKPSFQSFSTFNIIKEIGYLRFSYATDVDINKICQQHFLHAKDRINKKLKNKNKKVNINKTI